MDPVRPLAPCFIGSGTLTSTRDMIRALETLEAVDFVYDVDGAAVSEGEATLVKLMADPESSTIAVNGCLFLNVASFRYLDFSAEEDGRCVVRLYGDGTSLELRAAPERDSDPIPRGQLRLLEESAILGSFVVADEEDEED